MGRRMDQTRLKLLMEEVSAGKITPEEASLRLKALPFEDLGFAKVDHHRAIRRGHAETVFAQGKTPEQVVAIVGNMKQHGSNVLVTRCGPDTARTGRPRDGTPGRRKRAPAGDVWRVVPRDGIEPPTP